MIKIDGNGIPYREADRITGAQSSEFDRAGEQVEQSSGAKRSKHFCRDKIAQLEWVTTA